jgi:hypothetical protein
VEIAQGLRLQSIHHTDYTATRAALAALGLTLLDLDQGQYATASEQNLGQSYASLKSGGGRRARWFRSYGYKTDHLENIP